MHMHMETRHPRDPGVWAVNLGLGANVVLALLKTSIGIIGHSPALLADGINSTSDVAYYVVVRVFMIQAHKPADAEHPYGHRQMESVSALVVGAFVLTAAIAIFWNSVNEMYDLQVGKSSFGGASAVALFAALFTVLAKIALTFTTSRIGKETNNPAVTALAYDHRNDVFAASAAGIGILLGRMGIPWADPLAGALVAFLILRTGVEVLRQSRDDLMDTVPSQALSEQVTQIVTGIAGVYRVEEVLAHRFGPYVVLNITVAIDGSCTVAEGHQIANQIEQELYRSLDFVKRIHIHYHPGKR